VNRPALRPWLIRGPAGILGERIESAADAGVGTEQRDRAKASLGFIDQMPNIVFLSDIGLEGRAADRGRHLFRAREIEIGDNDFGGPVAVKNLAERSSDAVGAA